jgi:hypothetical protein
VFAAFRLAACRLHDALHVCSGAASPGCPQMPLCTRLNLLSRCACAGVQGEAPPHGRDSGAQKDQAGGASPPRWRACVPACSPRTPPPPPSSPSLCSVARTLPEERSPRCSVGAARRARAFQHVIAAGCGLRAFGWRSQSADDKDYEGVPSTALREIALLQTLSECPHVIRCARLRTAASFAARARPRRVRRRQRERVSVG